MNERKPTQAEQVHVLWQLLRVDRPAPHVCAFYRYNATVRLARCSDCANGSAPLAPQKGKTMTHDDIVMAQREMDDADATEMAHDELQEALAKAWEALLSVPAYVERYRRDGGAFDANLD